MLQIRDPQNLGAGAVFVCIGAAFALMSRNYPLGRLNDMGAGYFPMVLGIGLAGIGAVLVLKAVSVEGPPVERFGVRPIFWVTCAMILFGLLLERAGLVPAVAVLVLVGARASERFTWLSASILAVGLAIFSALVFVQFLGMSVPMFAF